MSESKQNKITEQNFITGETRTRLPYRTLGEIMIKTSGITACEKGYGTTDPGAIGRYALACGDINADGTTN